MSKNVYLAGPISGLTYDECTAWRDQASHELIPCGIECFSPLRKKSFLRDYGKLEQSYNHVLSTDAGIMTRDHNDVQRADCLLVNLLGCTPEGTGRVSVGTVMEMAWAWDRRIPVVAVLEKAGNLHDHPMIRRTIGFRVESVEDGIAVVKALLLP